MAGVWKKTLNYLGSGRGGRGVRRGAARGGAGAGAPHAPAGRPRGLVGGRGCRAHDRRPPAPRPAPSAIHKSEPKRFNEAREVADRFKDGTAVIMNLQSTEDTIARRLVDFASGLVYGLDGKIEMVANRVYLLSPADVEVSAEDRERIAGGGLLQPVLSRHAWSPTRGGRGC